MKQILTTIVTVMVMGCKTIDNEQIYVKNGIVQKNSVKLNSDLNTNQPRHASLDDINPDLLPYQSKLRIDKLIQKKLRS